MTKKTNSYARYMTISDNDCVDCGDIETARKNATGEILTPGSELEDVRIYELVEVVYPDVKIVSNKKK